MADESTTGAAGGASGNPEMVEVTFNNEVVRVPKELADKAHAMETSIKSGYDRKLAEERAALAREQEEFRTNFQKDVDAYNDLLARGITDFTVYNALTIGGDGTMDETRLTQATTATAATATTATTTTTTPATAFKPDDVKKIKDELKAELRMEMEVDTAVASLEAEVGQYPLFDAALVMPAFKKELSTYHDANGHAMSPKEIAKMVKARHDKLVEKLPAGVAARLTELPDTRGGGEPTRRTINDPRPAMSDAVGWAERARKLGVTR